MRSDAAPALETTGVTANTYGSATEVGQFTVDATGRITSASSVSIGGGVGTDEKVKINAADIAAGYLQDKLLAGSGITSTLTLDPLLGTQATLTNDSLAFKTIAVSGQNDVVADALDDTLTLAAGANMTITTNDATDTITFASTGGGGGSGVDVENSGVALGTATTLNFSTNLAASLAGSTATITASGGGGGGNQPVYKAHDGSASPYWGDNIRLLQDRTAAGGDPDMVNLNDFSYFTPLYDNQTNSGVASANQFQMSGDNNSIGSGLRNTTGIVLDVGAEFVLGCGIDNDPKAYPITIYDFDEYNSNVGAGTITKEAYWISNLNLTGLDNSTLGALQPGVDIFTQCQVKTYSPVDLNKFYITNNGNITAVYAGEYTLPKGAGIIDLFLIKDFGFNFQSGESTLVSLQ